MGARVGFTIWGVTSLGPMGGAVAGGEDPQTYRPPTIAPVTTDGYGEGVEVKTDFVLVSLSADPVDETLVLIPEPGEFYEPVHLNLAIWTRCH